MQIGKEPGARIQEPGGGVWACRSANGRLTFRPRLRLPTSPFRVGSRKLRRTGREATVGSKESGLGGKGRWERS
jgi:hypothetical protein